MTKFTHINIDRIKDGVRANLTPKGRSENNLNIKQILFLKSYYTAKQEGPL